MPITDSPWLSVGKQPRGKYRIYTFLYIQTLVYICTLKVSSENNLVVDKTTNIVVHCTLFGYVQCNINFSPPPLIRLP